MISEKDQAKPLDKTAIKCRFFGQYFEQIIAKETKYPNSPTINTTTVLLINELSNYHLELKPLSKIADEDCILIFNKFYPNAIRYADAEKIYDIKNAIKSNFSEDVIIDEDFIFYTDFMRSKGYAVPFMEYSVDDLVSFGWVRLV